jgi:methionyl-tRNA formyltransferase
MKIAVFVSGNGSNLQCIIDNCKLKEIEGIEISIVIADRNCYAVQRAKIEKIDCITVDRKENWQENIHILLKERNIELIVLAGFLSILEKYFCSQWENKIINIHPSLLPKYRGMSPQHWPIINGDNETGITVHFIDEDVDTGDIILQVKIPISKDEYVSELQNKMKPIYSTIVKESINIISKEDKTKYIKQNHLKGSYYKKLKENHLKIDINKSYIDAYNLIKGVSFPYPGARLDNLIIWKVTPVVDNKSFFDFKNGIVTFENEDKFIKFNDGVLKIIKSNKSNEK